MRTTARAALAMLLAGAFVTDCDPPLNFMWIGALQNVPDTTRSRLAERGSALMREVRAACGPQSPDTVTCEQYQVLRKSPPCGGRSG